jgi:quercetin dioxygenase-like cupin family protein
MTTEPTDRTSVVTQPGDARALRLLGGEIRMLATSEDTGGAFAVLEYTMSPRFQGPNRHTHARTTAAFFVLEGTVTFTLEGRKIEAGPGAFALVPPGTAHTFSNLTDAPARMLELLSPGGFERYFDELAGLLARDPGWPPDPQKLQVILERYDIQPA